MNRGLIKKEGLMYFSCPGLAGSVCWWMSGFLKVVLYYSNICLSIVAE